MSLLDMLNEYTVSRVKHIINITVYISSTRNYFNHQCCVKIGKICKSLKLSKLAKLQVKKPVIYNRPLITLVAHSCLNSMSFQL